MVFRGDNTVPVFEKKFAPLHNRCLLLLSKLVLDGHEGYWDNLYPSVEVARTVAAGGVYKATVPAGPNAGKEVTIAVPKTGTWSGLAQRMKSAMTTTEPPVICASVYDNAPVYMLSTIHTCAEIMTIFKPRCGS